VRPEPCLLQVEGLIIPEINIKAEIDYFMGFFNCYKLCKDSLSKLESIYLYNYSTARKIEDMYGLVKSLYNTLDMLQEAMFKDLRERHGDSIQYDLESNEFYVKSDVSS